MLASTGNTRAYRELGQLYESNRDISVCSHIMAAYYYRIGAELGDPFAQFKKAIFYYALAAEGGYYKHALEYAEACRKKLQALQATNS